MCFTRTFDDPEPHRSDLFVPAGRHRKTTPVLARLQRWGALTAPILAAATVVPVVHALEPAQGTGAAASATAGRSAAPAERAYSLAASRSLVRAEPPPTMADVEGLAEAAAAAGVDVSAADLAPRWSSVALNVRAKASDKSRLLAVVDPGEKVQVTGVVRGDWAQVARGKRLAWVHKAYLLRKKPTAKTLSSTGSTGSVSGRVSGAPCPDGSAVESGLVANTVAVYRSVCAAFPSVSSWGGRSGSGGNHSTGRALDIMVTGSTGDAIAAYVRAHARELGVSEVIWSRQIWTVQRAGDGWRPMSDRGSTTANHYDHVHVSTY